MPSSYTSSLRLVLPVTGELTSIWGDTVNNGLTKLVEDAIAGTASVAMGDANVTLTTATEAADQARCMFITLTGALTAQRNVVCPSQSKLYFVTNNTTGGYGILFKTSGGLGVVVLPGQRAALYCDGVDVLVADQQTLAAVQALSSNPEVSVASAATTTIGGLSSNRVRITGTTTISSFGTVYNGPCFLVFGGSLTLTHNATSLILPGGANITTVAGDACIAVPNLATPTGWRVLSYQKASGAAVIAPPAASEAVQGIVELATDAEAQAGLDTARALTAANLKAAQIQLGTAVTLTTQTSVDFTGIPSWAKRITVMFNGVSTNGTSPPILQFGDSGGIETTGYLGSAGVVGASTAASSLFTNGIGLINATAATVVMQGAVTLSLMTGTTWVASGVLTRSDSAGANLVGGSKATSAALDRIRLTTSGGTDQFDAGSVNISWE